MVISNRVSLDYLDPEWIDILLHMEKTPPSGQKGASLQLKEEISSVGC